MAQDLKFVYELHKSMIEKKIILVYEGEFTQEITKAVLSMAERNLESFREEENIKRKVFNVMVECLQNICKHTEDTDFTFDDMKSGAIFMIGLDEKEYIITSGNAILKENVPYLDEKLKKINSLDKEGLKALYKEIITKGNLSEKGGAGLGFVDMARKSGNKLDYIFTDVDDKHQFFALSTKISRLV
ncbi:MAG: SiaB family protein kinase [Cytophagales bacterium]